MIAVFDVCTFVFLTIIIFFLITRILKGNYNLFYIIIILVYIMQVLPIFVSLFGSLEKMEILYPYMYLALTDDKVAIVYNLFITLFILVLLWNSNKKKIEINLDNNVLNKLSKVKYIIFICLLCLLFAIMLAPDPSIYLKFSYFYTNHVDVLDDIYLYHINIINNIISVLFVLTILYYCSNDKKSPIFIYMIVFFISWLNGKRTLLTFILITMLVIDFIKSNKDKRKIKKVIYKSIFYMIILIIYFNVYNNITQKTSFADAYLYYSTYFSRMCNVKVSIYDKIYSNKMISYWGESVLYDILFFIPRNLWENKPYPFYRYFTSYVFTGEYNNFIKSSNFQTNIISEYVSNFGILGGFIFSLIFISTIVKISEESKNNIILFSGMIFLILYLTYGYEHIVRLTFLIWLVLNIKNKLVKNNLKKE